MFLYGEKILNDYNIESLINHLFSIKAIRGRDYVYLPDNKIKLNPTYKIINSKLCYEYKIESIANASTKSGSTASRCIGRKINYKKRKIVDYIFSEYTRSNHKISPYTFNWNYDHNCSSVSNYIMYLVSLIPIELRNNVEYVTTFLCSKIDSCNDPINGIIEGRWKSTFTGGIKPSEWRNSSHIFSERIKNRSPVKYGQCWILSDILTGIYLFLGLKSRSVRINNCIMDMHDTKGIDFYNNSNFMVKGGSPGGSPGGNPGGNPGGSPNSDVEVETHESRKNSWPLVNPLDMISNTDFDYSISSSNLELLMEKDVKIKTKGPLFSIEDDITINPNDLYSLNHFIEDFDNAAWNFHVWTEVFVNNDWVIYDSCPLHNAHSKFKPYLYERENGIKGKFFGPVYIKDIKNNISPGSGNASNPKDTMKSNAKAQADFNYLYNCINGQIRFWNPLVLDDNKITMYLSNVKRYIPQVIYKDEFGENIDVTGSYVNPHQLFYKDHPLQLFIEGNNMAKIYILPSKEVPRSDYVVQLSLFHGNTPLYIHRERINSFSYENLLFFKSKSIRKYRLKADKLTFCVYDLFRQLFWSQCIQT